MQRHPDERENGRASWATAVPPNLCVGALLYVRCARSTRADVGCGREEVEPEEQPLRIVVYGMPGAQGSKRFVGVKNGKGVMIESSAKVKPWRLAVKYAALAARCGQPPLDGPLVVTMVFTLPKPTGASKTKTTYPKGRPDLSKLLRSTEDALTDAGAWKDDARVIEYARAAKVYPNEDPDALDAPGVVIEIRLREPDLFERRTA